MSTKENKRGKLEVPRLQGDALQWAETILAIGMPYTTAVRAFLESFPSYAEHETLSEDEVFNQLLDRFRRMRRDTRRVSYQKIKETQESLKTLLDCIPVASPLIRLIELEQLRQDAGLKCEQRLKVLGAALRETEVLMPRERTSPFGGLPDLIPKNTTPKTEVETTPKQGDGFGGAIMNNANTGQETPQDS